MKINLVFLVFSLFFSSAVMAVDPWLNSPDQNVYAEFEVNIDGISKLDELWTENECDEKILIPEQPKECVDNGAGGQSCSYDRQWSTCQKLKDQRPYVNRRSLYLELVNEEDRPVHCENFKLIASKATLGNCSLPEYVSQKTVILDSRTLGANSSYPYDRSDYTLGELDENHE